MKNRSPRATCGRDCNSGTARSVIAHAHYTFALMILAVIFLPLTTARAQSAVSYRFLEVVDTAGKPVVDAKIETGMSTQQTDENGTIKKLPVYYGDYQTTQAKISKPGYYTYLEYDAFRYYQYEHLLRGENVKYDPMGPIKIELLKMPVTAAEFKAVAGEQSIRELLQAIKNRDAVTVRSLLQAGVNANARDVNGIPVILWAATCGDEETINALLTAGADVRSRGTSGRKALLYYLYIAYEQNEEVVRTLLKAGADVNATDKDLTTPMILAQRTGNDKIVKQLESAGAKRQ